MKLMNWFKGAKAKAFVILGSFAMLLGVGASIYSVKAAVENEVVETKADAPYGNMLYLEDYWISEPYAHLWSVTDYPGRKMSDTGKVLDWNGTSRKIWSVNAAGATGVTFNKNNGNDKYYDGQLGDAKCSVSQGLNMYIKRDEKWVKWDGVTDCWADEHRTIYFLKGRDWDADWYTVRLHYWNGQYSNNEWSSEAMSYVGEDIVGNYIYSLSVATYMNHFKFHSNSRSMTQTPSELEQSSTQTLCDGTASNAWKSLITYNANDGEETPAETMAAHTAGDGLLDCETLSFEAPDHKHFKEWNTQADGGGVSYSETQTYSGGEIKLYAIWEDDVHAVTITGTGTTAVYLASVNTITSTSDANLKASGTSFTYNSTVYGYAVLSGGYAHLGAWTLKSGTADTAGAFYLVGSITVSATPAANVLTANATSGETDAVNWAKAFNKAIRGEDGGVCVSDGSTNTSSLLTAWSGQSTTYTALAAYKKYWLAESTKSSNTNVTTALAQYDWVCGKYGPNGKYKITGLNDFLGRNPADQSLAHVVPSTPTGTESPLTLTLWIVLGAGILGMGAIGTAYFVSKKKKRHQA